jgi:hypothetical protein
LCDTKTPYEYLRDSKTGAGTRLRDAVCWIAPFRRDRVSEVCQGGGILLAFAAFPESTL